MNKQQSCHSQLKVKLKIIVCDKKNQNGYCKKAEKIKQSDLNETVSTKNSNSYEKNKGMNLKII